MRKQLCSAFPYAKSEKFNMLSQQIKCTTAKCGKLLKTSCCLVLPTANIAKNNTKWHSGKFWILHEYGRTYCRRWNIPVKNLLQQWSKIPSLLEQEQRAEHQCIGSEKPHAVIEQLQGLPKLCALSCEKVCGPFFFRKKAKTLRELSAMIRWNCS